MNYFQRLPEGCILEILSRTTPVDAVRSCILSRGFKTALESEIIWERFLPSDYQEIIERSEFPSVCTTKKELYFSLCEYPILLDGGKLSFSLDKHSGKKCFMVAPRELIISWGDNLNHWQWKPHPDSRLLPRRFRQNRAWMELNKIWRTNTKVKGFIIEKVKGGYSVAIAGFITFLPFRRRRKRISNDRFTIENINPKKTNIVVF
ncbi:F-box protein PP2-B3-like isoform X2 [Nicotiana tabacum]|uniref:F-box protein PP2-B3-like isoform X2 n=1 Tax=Nicotiana tabacum TaxID=4097 RepID=A0AC58TJX7_TOBAC